MTGESIPTKENWHRLEPYYKKLVSSCLILVGTFLMMEHLWTFNGFDIGDWIGHEYYGLAMIISGFLLSMKWHQWKSLNLKNPSNWWR